MTPNDPPRASVVTEALLAVSVGALPQGDDDPPWAQLDTQLARLAGDLAIAIDDRPKLCRSCGVAAVAPPLASLATLLQPATPPATLATDHDKARRLAPVVWVLGILLGQCDRHRFPGTLADVRPTDV
jgi:hypothetical protein